MPPDGRAPRRTSPPTDEPLTSRLLRWRKKAQAALCSCWQGSHRGDQAALSTLSVGSRQGSWVSVPFLSRSTVASN